MILLSFDIEEFDVPVVEYGMHLSFEEQMKYSIQGTNHILNILEKYKVKATFFCTANFANNSPQMVKKIVAKGHELASHGYYHSTFCDEDYEESKKQLEKITGYKIKGFRMARMKPVNYALIQNCGYRYDSSLNPTYLPSRYNHFNKPRTLFKNKYTTILPASVTPLIRFPLFWLSFHNLPYWVYKFFAKITLKKDGYLNIYFHPWEFVKLNDKKFGLPFYFRKNSGQNMIYRLEKLIKYFRDKNIPFTNIAHFLKEE